MVETHVRWRSGQRFEATTGSGHTAVADGGPEYGGGETGPRPLELVLVALASCAGVAVMTILHRQRQPVTGLTIAARAERADEWPRAIVGVHLDYQVTGSALSTEAVTRAVRLAESKYCSVAGSLRAPVSSSISVVDTTIPRQRVAAAEADVPELQRGEPHDAPEP